MKAPAFKYVRAESLEDVFDVLDRYGEEAKILAGGQSLLPALNLRLSSPAVLIDVNAVAALRGVAIAGQTLHIGALTRHCEVERSGEIATAAPLLGQAIVHVGHPAIRSRGTLGGSVAHADPCAEIPAVSLALGARFVLASRRGERRVAAEEFFRGLYETALQPDEVIVAAEFPARRDDERCAFGELARRHGDFAIVGACARARLREGCAGSVRVALFGLGAVPVLARAVMRALEGKRLDASAIAAAQRALQEDIDPRPDLYSSAQAKRHLAAVQLGRTLMQLAG